MAQFIKTLLFEKPSKEVEKAAILFLKIEFAVLFIFGLIMPSSDWYIQPWAIDLTHWVAYVIPQIDRFTEIGIEPEVNRFYFSVLWVLSPINGYVLYKAMLSSIWIGESKKTVIQIEDVMILFIGFVFITIFYVYLLGFNDSNRYVHGFLGNRLGRALFGFSGGLTFIFIIISLPVFYSAEKAKKIKISLFTWSK